MVVNNIRHFKDVRWLGLALKRAIAVEGKVTSMKISFFWDQIFTLGLINIDIGLGTKVSHPGSARLMLNYDVHSAFIEKNIIIMNSLNDWFLKYTIIIRQ